MFRYILHHFVFIALKGKPSLPIVLSLSAVTLMPLITGAAASGTSKQFTSYSTYNIASYFYNKNDFSSIWNMRKALNELISTSPLSIQYLSVHLVVPIQNILKQAQSHSYLFLSKRNYKTVMAHIIVRGLFGDGVLSESIWINWMANVNSKGRNLRNWLQRTGKTVPVV